MVDTSVKSCSTKPSQDRGPGDESCWDCADGWADDCGSRCIGQQSALKPSSAHPLPPLSGVRAVRCSVEVSLRHSNRDSEVWLLRADFINLSFKLRSHVP